LDATARSGVQIKEVSADKGYDSFNNRRLTLEKRLLQPNRLSRA
jgi:hypothetical protein